MRVKPSKLGHPIALKPSQDRKITNQLTELRKILYLLFYTSTYSDDYAAKAKDRSLEFEHGILSHGKEFIL